MISGSPTEDKDAALRGVLPSKDLVFQWQSSLSNNPPSLVRSWPILTLAGWLAGMTSLSGGQLMAQAHASAGSHGAKPITPAPAPDEDQRKAAQKKLDSHIVMALKKSRKEPPFDKATTYDPDLKIEADGRVLVDIQAAVNTALLEEIAKGDGKIINHFEKFRSIRALVPLARIEALALRADIQFIAPAAEATTNTGGGAAAGGNIKP